MEDLIITLKSLNESIMLLTISIEALHKDNKSLITNINTLRTEMTTSINTLRTEMVEKMDKQYDFLYKETVRRRVARERGEVY